jgi:thiamine kinase-like enzyme
MCQLIATMQQQFPQRVPCHNDLIASNLLDDGQQLWAIDWEYAGNNDPFFDLATLVANWRLSRHQQSQLIEAYQGQCLPVDLAHLDHCRAAYHWLELLWLALFSELEDKLCQQQIAVMNGLLGRKA